MAKRWTQSGLTADDFYNEAMASFENMTVYDGIQDLDEWLAKYKPSKMLKADGHGYIGVEAPRASVDLKDGDHAEDSEASEGVDSAEQSLQREWTELQETQKPISFSSIRQLAVKYGIMSGTWMIIAKEDEVDSLWGMVAKEFVHGNLSRIACLIRVSPKRAPGDIDDNHMIVVGHGNFTDEDRVFELEKALRNVGIRKPLKYKPDIHAHLKIYRVNEHNLRPSIYASYFEPRTHSYCITRLYNVDARDPSCRHLLPRTTLWDAYYVKHVEQFSEDTDEFLSAWLEEYAPSRCQETLLNWRMRQDNTTPSAKTLPSGWIVLESQDSGDIGPDITDLQMEWQELKESGNPINVRSVIELAKRNKVLSGGWLFRVAPGFKVDVMWKKISENFAGGLLTGVATKVQVSPPNPEDHVIVVKNRDFTNLHEVFRLHDQIRAVGVKPMLVYRPDVFTHLAMFGNNQYDIKPVLYLGQYDVLKRATKMICLHGELNSEFCRVLEGEFEICEEELRDTEMGFSGKFFTGKSRDHESPLQLLD